MASRNLKIISDGTALGTRIVDAETGEPIRGVQSVTWDIDIETGYAKCEILAIGWPVELAANAEIIK